MPGNRRLTICDVGPAQKFQPLGADKGASDRDLAILPDDPVPAGQSGQQREPVIGNEMAVQIADEPTFRRVRLQPAQEVDDLVIRQVVGELGADDKVERKRWSEGERVAGVEDNSVGWIGGLGRRPYSTG